MSFDLKIITALTAALAVAVIVYIVFDLILKISKEYQSRYIDETNEELDTILLQLSAKRLFELSLLTSVSLVVIAVGLYVVTAETISWLIIAVIVAFTLIPAFLLPKLFIRYLKNKRLLKFNLQLEDALVAMSSSLKAGFSINQALEELARGKLQPISVEFRLLIQEIHIGVPLDEALFKMADRLGSSDFELVAAAISTSRQTGGNLTVIFERLANLIRERNRINSKLHSLSAAGKLQAYIISIMPWILLVIMIRLMPGTAEFFFGTLGGIVLLAVCLILDVTGFLVIKKILTIDV